MAERERERGGGGGRWGDRERGNNIVLKVKVLKILLKYYFISHTYVFCLLDTDKQIDR